MLNFLEAARRSAREANIPIKKSTELWLGSGNLTIRTPSNSPPTKTERKRLKEWRRIENQLIFRRGSVVEEEAIKAALSLISRLIQRQETGQRWRRELETLVTGVHVEPVPSYYGFQQSEPIIKIRLLRFIKILKAAEQACGGDYLVIELSPLSNIQITSPRRPSFKVTLRLCKGLVGGRC